MSGVRIESLEHLKQLAGDSGTVEVVLALNGGAFTRRTIHRDGAGGWDVFHGSCDAWQESSTDDDLRRDDPMLFEGIEAGALWTSST